MAQTSRRLRSARKLKRQLTLHQRELEHQMNLNNTFRQMLVEYRMKEIQDQQAKEQDAGSLIVKPTLKQIVQSEGLA